MIGKIVYQETNNGNCSGQTVRAGKSAYFFSSRRRHTRLTCDWSSDVCSSDLSVLLVDTVRPWPCSTSNTEMPLWRGVALGSVLHSSAMSCDRRALLIQVLEPLITRSSPSARAVVVIACRSEPPPGSVSAIVARISPVAIPGRYFCFCSEVPNNESSLHTTV